MRIFYLILFICVFGCGKRTTTTNKTDIKTDSITISKNYFLEQNIKLNDIGSIRPFDSSKPIIIDGKYYYNTIIDFDKSIDYKGIEKSGVNLSYTVVSENEKTKETERVDNATLYLGLFFIVCLFIFLYIKIK